MTVGIISISLLFVGTFLIIFLNLNLVLNSWKDDVQVTAYLDGKISSENITKIKDRITDFKETSAVKYISKKEALTILKKGLQTNDSLFEGLGTNPLPASLEIQLKKKFLNSNGIKDFVAKIKGFKEIKDIQYDREWIKGFFDFLNFFRIGSLALGIVLFLATVFIITNTIRLSIHSRREELEIQRLVGATNFFIRTPFLIEGLLQGLLGALLSIGMLYIFYQIFISRAGHSISLYFRGLPPSFIPVDFVLCIIIGGILIGIFGSTISLRRFLRI